MTISARVGGAVLATLLALGGLPAGALAQTAGTTVRLTGNMQGSFPLESVLGLGAICANLGNISLPQGYATVLPCNSDGQLITSGGGGGGGGNVTIVGPFGQALMGASVPVAIASNQSAVPVSGTVAVTGVATSANQSSQITQETTTATGVGAPADAAYAGSGSASIIAALKGVYGAVAGPVPAGTALIGNVGAVYPAGSTPITASATGTTGATTATLAASSSLHTYVCGFSIRANATAAATADSTVTGTVTGTLHYTQWTPPAALGLGLTEQIFQPCVISSAINTGIAVISAAPGSGGVVSVSAWGFQL